MSKEKQIIEIKECIDSVYGADCAYFDVDGFAIANKIYNAGYRKQNDEELIDKIATYFEEEENWERLMRGTWNVCGNSVQLRDMLRDAICGAKMKGGLE